MSSIGSEYQFDGSRRHRYKDKIVLRRVCYEYNLNMEEKTKSPFTNSCYKGEKLLFKFEGK
jgi:hypothetical protein